jgi:hypothetical protein
VRAEREAAPPPRKKPSADAQPGSLEERIERLEARLAGLAAGSKAHRAVQAELETLYAQYVHN